MSTKKSHTFKMVRDTNNWMIISIADMFSFSVRSLLDCHSVTLFSGVAPFTIRQVTKSELPATTVPKSKMIQLTISITHSLAVDSIKLPRLRIEGTQTPTKIPSCL